MRVDVETLPNCTTLLHVELPAERVQQEKTKIINQFANFARLPGYRPGKAPRTVVEAKFRKEIADELTRNLVDEGTREAIKSQQLHVLSIAEVRDVQLKPDQTLRFAARLVTAPEFELPDYRHIPVELPPAELPEADVTASIERLRARFADFVDIADRGLETGDFAVLDYAGRLDGRPLAEAVPGTPAELGGRENFWLPVGPQTLVPGFCEPLLGARAEETRTYAVTLPAELGVEGLAGKSVEYTVKVRELKRQVLPEFDDAFAAKLLPGKSAAELLDQLRHSLQHEREDAREELKRAQIRDYLLRAVEFELPPDYVRSETKRIAQTMVRENQDRGVSDEEIREHQKEIVGNAGQVARDRLKSAFILVRIAGQEGIKVTAEERDHRLGHLAERAGMPKDKLLERLQHNGALPQVDEEILLAKTLAFLGSNASVQTVVSPVETPAPASGPQPSAAPANAD